MRKVVLLAAVALLAAPVEASAAGGAPAEPVVHSPTQNAEWGEQADQAFLVSATDPEGDPYRAVVWVTQVATGASTAFSSAETRSGMIAVVRPTVELPHGAYTWTATAVDTNGNAGPASPARNLTVSGRPAASHPSEDCRTGAATPVDGIVAGSFVRVRASSPTPGEWWVCVRTDVFGGKFVVRQVRIDVASSPPVSADGESTACATTPGNAAPGPRPVASDGSGSSLDVYRGPAGVWVCLQAGPVATRVVVPVSRAGGITSVAFLPDGPSWKRPAPAVNPAPVSGRCQRTPGAVTVVNADIGGGHVWLETARREADSQLDVCARSVVGQAADGGALAVDADGSRIGSDATRCGNTLVAAPAGGVRVTWSEQLGPPKLPMWVCVAAEGVGPVVLTLSPRDSVSWMGD